MSATELVRGDADDVADARGAGGGAGGGGLPLPRRVRGLGHLSRWTNDPLALLTEGARLGPVFGLQLWRPATVGYSPEWNRFVLGDLDGFRSRGSLSQLSPYLSTGVVAMDNPHHRQRRAELNPTFHRRAVTTAFATDFTGVADALVPAGAFEVGAWTSQVILEMLGIAFFGAEFPRAAIRSFVAPLDSEMPGPLLRRPFRIRRIEAALTEAFRSPQPGTLAELFASIDNGAQEARVAIAAAYDTTAHTLAFALWELSVRPELNRADMVERVVDETLRLYPSGWIGSRVSTRDTSFDGHPIPAGRLVLYSPYLTHRSAELWPDPTRFRPERFDEPRPAWGYIPFSAGERTCLGGALATLMLRTAVSAFLGSDLTRNNGDGAPRGGLTLAPSGPLWLRRDRRWPT